MVLLTMTSSIVEALNLLSDAELTIVGICEHNESGQNRSSCSPPFLEKSTDKRISQLGTDTKESVSEFDPNIPDLKNPKVGNPISHSQILDLFKAVKSTGREQYHIEDLLRGSRLYIPKPSPNPEQTLEYKTLMTRLRQEEEARTYQKITKPLSSFENFPQRYSSDSAAYAFSLYRASSSDETDEITYADVNRQMTLILNVLISIVACGAAIWIVARYWSTPIRLALSMSGSIIVGIAEVTVYSGYIRRVRKAKIKEKSTKEIKKVIKSWNVQADKGIDPNKVSEESIIQGPKNSVQNTAVRRRR